MEDVLVMTFLTLFAVRRASVVAACCDALLADRLTVLWPASLATLSVRRSELGGSILDASLPLGVIKANFCCTAVVPITRTGLSVVLEESLGRDTEDGVAVLVVVVSVSFCMLTFRRGFGGGNICPADGCNPR